MNLKLQTKSRVFYAFLMALFSVWGWGQGTITIVPDKTTTGTTATSYITALTPFTAQNINWVIKQWNPNTLQVRGNQSDAFAFYNTSAIPGTITKVTLNTTSGTFNNANIKLAVGSSNQASETTGNSGVSSTNKIEWTPSAGSTYFKIIFLNGATSGTAMISNITIEYSNLSTSAPTVTASSFSGTVGTSFSEQIIASETPSSYELVSGSTLPLGLSLNTSTGIISGTPTEAGTFTTSVTATNSIGTSSPVDITFNVSKGTQNVILNDLNVNVGASNITLPNTTNEGLAINYVSSNNSVALISGNILTIGDIGSATITASNIGDANYLAFNRTFDINVNFDSSVQPVANAATSITSNSFVANWDVIPGANSYNLDVYQSSGSLNPDVSVVGWTFENASNLANSGLTINNTSSISTNATGLSYASMTNNPVSNGIVATTTGGWNNGINSKYWKISFSTTGITNIKLSSVQRSSNTGPRDFKLQYSLDDANWTDVSGATITVQNDWASGALSNTLLPIDCENKSIVHLRWIMTSNKSANNGSVADGGTSAIDDIQVIGDQGSITINYILQDQNVGNVTSYTVNNVLPNSTYYYKIRGVNGAIATVDSNEVSVATLDGLAASTTWDGSTWSNGLPINTVDVNLTGLYTTATSPAFTANNINIKNGGVLDITSGNIIVAENVIIEDGGNLIQHDGSTLDYAGTFKVLKNGISVVNKYAFWSSPVASQSLSDIYGAGITPDFITEYNTSTDYFVNASSTTSVFGKGYSIKTPAVSNVIFEGTPNNGTQNFTLNTTGNGFNLVGNPYPSNLNLNDFYTANSTRISNTFYFWDNTSNSVTTQGGATTTNVGYATYNPSTSVWVPAPNVVSVPTESVANIGQGFIVKALNSSVDPSLVFNNDMREAISGSFFNKNNSIGEGKFWLRLNSSYNTNNTFAVAYLNGASDSFDNYDSKAMAIGSDAFYTLADAQKLVIQGKDSFDVNDVVPIGTKHFENGNFTIALAKKEGIFNNGQAIYLHDKLNNTYTNLQTDSYSFVANAGESSNRFEIVYKLNTLSTVEVKNEAFEVYKDGEDFFVRNNKNIEKVEIFDASGRKIKDIKSQSNLVKVTLDKGVYIIKALSGGKEYTKKVVK